MVLGAHDRGAIDRAFASAQLSAKYGYEFLREISRCRSMPT